MSTPRPPFDPELLPALARVNAEMPPGIVPEQIDAMRARAVRLAPGDETDMTLGGIFTESEHTAPGPDGHPVPLLVWRPKETTATTGALYWIHGGGMIGGTHRGGEILELLQLARELDLIVVSVDYRLAPEHPYPAPVEDCYAGLVWLSENTAELGVDPERIVVGGASAGGGLAAAVNLLARDRGGPALRAQLLLYPMLDDRNASVSAHQMAGVGTWDRTSNDTGWGCLLQGAHGGPDTSSYAAPARAQDLSNLPPTYLEVGTAETFRDEVVEYASRIWKAGGRAELHVWPGGYHSFDAIAPDAALSRSARGQRLPWLRRVLTH